MLGEMKGENTGSLSTTPATGDNRRDRAARDIVNAPCNKASGPVSPLPGSEGLCFVAALVAADTILEK